MREDLPQYPGQPSNIFKENKEQFFSFLDDYFAKNPPRQSDEPVRRHYIIYCMKAKNL